MSLKDWSDLFIFLGFALGALTFFIVACLAFPKHSRFSILFKEHRDILKEDEKNPAIVAGGPLGIMKRMLTIGVASLLVGTILRLFTW